MTRCRWIVALMLVVGGCGADDSERSQGSVPIHAPVPPPPAPSNLAAVPNAAGGVLLTWTDNSTNEGDFGIERSLDGAAFSEIAVAPANSGSYVDASAQASTTYTYRVRGHIARGTSAWVTGAPSNSATVTTDPAAPVWIPESPAGVSPPGRFSHSAVYDPIGRRILVVGGAWVGNMDVHALSVDPGATKTWTLLTTAGTPPPYRYGHAAVYDAGNRALIVFGGNSGGTIVEDVWRLTLPETGTPTWSPVTVSGDIAGDGRSGVVAGYDPAGARMIVFGGSDENDDAFNDVWSLSLPAAGSPAWSPLAPSGPGPSVRSGAAGAWDSIRSRLIVWGGWDNGGLTDTWALELPAGGTPSWNPVALSTAAPPWRYRHASAYDAVNRRLLVFGGNLGGASLDANNVNEMWALSLPDSGPSAWTLLAPSGTAPSVRWGSAAAAAGGDCYVIGGYAATNQFLADVYRFR